jgi:hypothetical protein
MRARLELDGLVTPSQNKTEREHWSKKSKRIREYEWCIVAATKGQQKPHLGAYVKVHIISHRCGNPISDRMNLGGGCKHLVDALVHMGWLTDDSEKYMLDTYSQVRVPHRVDQRTVIELEWEPAQ